MIKLLLELPLFISIILFLSSLILLGILIYYSFHYYFARSLSKSHLQIGRVLFRTSASLLALLLSFTYASQRVDYFNIKHSLEAEASQIVDIHIDLELFDDPASEHIQEKLYSYIDAIIEEGWKPLAEDPFRSNSFILFREIYIDLLDLETGNDFQEKLKENMLTDIDEISDFMQVRIYQTKPSTPFLLYIAIFGFVVIMIFFSVYKPDRISITLISLYNAFIGLVLFFVILMNNPLIGPLQMRPESFQILYDAVNLVK